MVPCQALLIIATCAPGAQSAAHLPLLFSSKLTWIYTSRSAARHASRPLTGTLALQHNPRATCTRAVWSQKHLHSH